MYLSIYILNFFLSDTRFKSWLLWKGIFRHSMANIKNSTMPLYFVTKTEKKNISTPPYNFEEVSVNIIL
jgi:hypothetical protein